MNDLLVQGYKEPNSISEYKIHKITLSMLIPKPVADFPSLRFNAVKMEYFIYVLRWLVFTFNDGSEFNKFRFHCVDSLTKIHVLSDKPDWHLKAEEVQQMLDLIPSSALISAGSNVVVHNSFMQKHFYIMKLMVFVE